jgi:putative transposase
MANTYTQIHIHIVFAVKYRAAVIKSSWSEQLHKYSTAIVQNRQHKMLAINSMEDHIHLLVGMRPTQSLSDLLQDIKTGSSKWINERKFCSGLFRWQEGYGAFAVNKPGVNTVIDYIKNQQQHHQKKTFRDEYRQFLIEQEIEFDEKYVFEELQ